MKEREKVVVNRDCEAIEIPAGTKTQLKAGTEVVLMQSLGGTYTVYTPDGALVRVDGKDFDALGIAVIQQSAAAKAASGKSMEEQVWEQLKSCYDPEIPVNIVDLGLVYLCEAAPLEGGGYRVDIRMTLTAPGCGMGPVLTNDVETKVRNIPGVRETHVELVFDPTWDQSMMSEAAKLQLGML